MCGDLDVKKHKQIQKHSSWKHISERGMGLIILIQVLNLYLVIVSGHNYNRFNQVGTGASAVEDCELRSMVTSIKEALVKAGLEKCLIKPNGEYFLIY